MTIQTSFKTFCVAACAARVAEATEHVRAETRRIEHPDVTVLELLRAKGYTAQSHVVRLLGELVGVREAAELFDEWRDYRFELRMDRAVHARYFECIEESNLHPGNFSDRCFMHVTLNNMYDNDLWRLASPKPRKQARFAALILAMRRLDYADALATGQPAKRQKARGAAGAQAQAKLNNDAGLLDPRTVEDALTLERADAALSLETMRVEWDRAVAALAARTAEVTRAVEALEVEQLRALLVNASSALATLPDCRAAKNELRELATRAFVSTARNLLHGHLASFQQGDDLAFGAAHVAAVEENRSALAELRARDKEQPTLDALQAQVLDWLRRDCLVTSRSVVRTALSNCSSIAARALAPTAEFAQLQAHIRTFSEGAQSVADKLNTQLADQRGIDRTVEVHVSWLMRVCAHEHVRDVLARLLSPDEHRSMVAQGGKAVRAKLEARMRQAWTDVADVLKKTYTRGMQFVQQYVDPVLAPTAGQLLVGKHSAADVVSSVSQRLEAQLLPALAECKAELLAGHQPVPVIVDMAPSAGLWLVDRAVFRAFVDEHLSPAVDELRVAQLDVEPDDDDDDDHIQALILLADAEQLANSHVSPTFRRVFHAVRCVHQLQLHAQL